MKYLKYIKGISCLIFGVMLWFDVPGLADTRTIVGTLSVLLSDIYFNFKEENN